VVSEAPPFWWGRADWRAWSLYPLSAAYGAVARHRLLHADRKPVPAPVLCVGNLTVGGSGKTPVAIALASKARAMGLTPGILSRGHGGQAGKPHIVDLHHDSARHVGDEPLLLARVAPVAVSVDREAGARLLIDQGCDFLIMDDGFQSARILIDYALIVVDARRGIGNGHTIPGGPMRASLIDQMRYADGVLRVGEGDGADLVIRHAARAGRPFFEAAIRARAPEGFAGTRCLAYAGIGEPAKFFDTVRALGGEVVAERNFADHHFYSAFDAQDLLATASEMGLALVTTAKDAVRLDHASEALGRLKQSSTVIEIEAEFELETTWRSIIGEAVESFRRRKLASETG
jgi:tetraacyldisaccharide 4'-kinase